MKNAYTVTWKLYCSWTVEQLFRGIRFFTRLIFCLLGGIAFGRSFAGGFRPLFLVLSFLCMYFAFLRDIRRAKKEYDDLANEYGEDDWKRTITLEDDRIVLEEGSVCKEYSYSDIKNMYERKNHFCLVMRSGAMLRLYKSGMVESAADECWTLLERKMDEAGEA